ncbi:MAG: sigma-B regulation protein RsbU (phosphoserine phosphatase) [Flavobacteriales bacterium]|jgi:sigma-B regulation protein RsbU (phosphoserine phosphatase)
MRNILVIEDDTALQETICDLLELHAYQVETASNGIEGLEIAKNKQLDLVICDINMPLMNGYETVKKFRELEQNIFIPFVFLSALSSMENLRAGMDLGADDFMAKPFENHILIKLIERLLNKYSGIKKREQGIRDVLENYKDEIRLKWIDYKDSMERAKMVQNAILPHPDELKDLFDEYGLFYAPKEIISGDFYWAKEVNGKKLIAVGDCTGHGVPAALMTMVCSNMMSICVDYFNLQEPKEILNRVNELVSDFMSTGNINLSDGMDIALCSIDYENKKILFSGAKRPLYIMSNGLKPKLSTFLKQNKHRSNLYEIMGSIESIGFGEFEYNLEEHSINFEKGDQIYLSSDGFCDQFGGANKKKYKTYRLLDLFHKSYNLPLSHQTDQLKKSFTEWKGIQEQTDDATVFMLKF